MAQRKRGESLQQLVTRLLDDRDMSGREFARQAAERGYTVSYTTINSIKNGTRRTVTDDTLRAISEVFAIAEDQVRAAAGVPPRDESTDADLLKFHARLTPEEKRAGLRMYEEWVKSVRQLRDKK